MTPRGDRAPGSLGIAADPRSAPEGESLGITGDPNPTGPRKSLGIIWEMSGDHPEHVWGSPVIYHQPIPTNTNQTRRVADPETQLTTARESRWK